MLDYTQRAKRVLEVKLDNGDALKLGAPRKKLFSRLAGLEKGLKNTENIEPLYDDILDVCANVLSNNTAGKEYTAADIDELMDIEDMSLLLREYAAFAGRITSDPN